MISFRLAELKQTKPPMHLHLVRFQISTAAPSTPTTTSRTKTAFPGPAVQPEPNDLGWNETVQCSGGSDTRSIARFGVPRQVPLPLPHSRARGK